MLSKSRVLLLWAIVSVQTSEKVQSYAVDSPSLSVMQPIDQNEHDSPKPANRQDQVRIKCECQTSLI